MTRFRFITDVRCHLITGQVQMLRSLAVPVEAADEDDATFWLNAIAHEVIDDAGSRLLDAPLDYCEVTDYRAAERRF